MGRRKFAGQNEESAQSIRYVRRVGRDVLIAPQPSENAISLCGGCGAVGTPRPTAQRTLHFLFTPIPKLPYRRRPRRQALTGRERIGSVGLNVVADDLAVDRAASCASLAAVTTPVAEAATVRRVPRDGTGASQATVRVEIRLSRMCRSMLHGDRPRCPSIRELAFPRHSRFRRASTAGRLSSVPR